MIPQGWEEKSLYDIAEITTGKWDANHSVESGLYKFYTCASEPLLCNTFRYCGDCLIFPGNGANVGDVYRYSGKFDAYQRTYVASNIKHINVSYLYYFLLLYWKKANSDKQYGSATNYIKIGNFKDFIISYPPLPEQERIVAKLDKVFEAIDKAKIIAETNLKNAKELFESYLTSILVNKKDWEKKKLSEVAVDFGRGRSRHRPRNDKKLYGGKYPFIQTGDIRNCNHFITKYSQTYNEVGLAQSKLWPKGTLCITIAANIAETGVLTFDSCFPDSVIGCVFDNLKTNIDYVEYLLQSFKSVLQAEGKGSAQDNINLGTFEGQYFPFPDKSTQDKIVIKLDSMRKNIAKLEAIYTKKIKALDELKQSILQKAFRGEL